MRLRLCASVCVCVCVCVCMRLRLCACACVPISHDSICPVCYAGIYNDIRKWAREVPGAAVKLTGTRQRDISTFKQGERGGGG